MQSKSIVAWSSSVRDLTCQFCVFVRYAAKVIIVPGYGLAAAQGQQKLYEFVKLLQSEGVNVRFAIHPVAGRTGVLGGLDTLVFTAGIGENSPPVRAALCRELQWLGVKLDDKANAAGCQCISEPSSRVSVFVIPTNEELMIAQHTLSISQNPQPKPG